MDIVNAETAREWWVSWENESPTRKKRMLRMILESQRTCVKLCHAKIPLTRAGHEAAVAELEGIAKREFPEGLS